MRQRTLQQNQLHFYTDQMAVLWSLTCAAVILSLCKESGRNKIVKREIDFLLKIC